MNILAVSCIINLVKSLLAELITYLHTCIVVLSSFTVKKNIFLQFGCIILQFDVTLSRVTTGELGKKGHGKDLFIRNTELDYDPHRQVQYLKNDTLLFRVVDVTETSSL